MAAKKRHLVVCSCEDTMPLDLERLRRACPGADITSGRQFCRSELERFRALASGDSAITMACTQEAPIFSEIGEETGADLGFVNIRENAGWSKDAAKAAPKMAALLSAAEPLPDIPFVSFESEGIALIYGDGDAAIEMGESLKNHLDVTVMIPRPKDIAPRRATDFPIVQGTIRAAKGCLGKFEVAVDDYAVAAPSSRASLSFGAPRNGATSRCDIILDVSGGAPLFPAPDLREGYLRADPRDPITVMRAAMKARDLVGTFDKPRYIEFRENLCAHSRSRVVGCRRCLDLCPAGAIQPAGDHVAIDPHVCAGCGQCATNCPTGAASYALPSADFLMRRLRTMLTAYHAAGGTNPVLLFHDAAHGADLISALARHGDGLPDNAIPVEVNEVTQVGLEAIAASVAYGATAIRFLLRAKPRHDVTGLRRTIELAEPILSGLGFGTGRVAAVETDDPDELGEALRAIPASGVNALHANFLPMGGKREVQLFALRELHKVAPTRVDVISLPAGAPFGTIDVKVEGCTLCLACVSACPTGAMSADPERPMLKFAEAACVQCGLCAATCPEKVIALKPQIDFRAPTAMTRIVKEEEPFHCISCDKPFGVRSTIERVTAKLEGKHWMFKGNAKRLDVLRMCEDCRVVAMTQDSFDPYAGVPERAAPRTTEDYLREREEKSRS
jgi:ferredoxin